jgi:hypothetical protein
LGKKFSLTNEQWACIVVLGFEGKERGRDWKNKNILEHIPSMMRRKCVVGSCYAYHCKRESTKIIWNTTRHKKIKWKRKKDTRKEEEEEEEEGNEGLASFFKKHFDEKMRMPFLIACSFLLEIENHLGKKTT